MMMLSLDEVIKVVNNADMLKTRPEKLLVESPSNIRKRGIRITQNLDISNQRHYLMNLIFFLKICVVGLIVYINF